MRAISVAEQRYQAVLAVISDGLSISQVASKVGVSRQTVHAWLARYAAEGLEGLKDRSHRPARCPHQMLAAAQLHPGLITQVVPSPFGLVQDKRAREEPLPLPVAPPVLPQAQAALPVTQPQPGAVAQNRRIDVSAVPVAAPANDAGPGAAGGVARDTRIVTVASPNGEPLSAGAQSRTRGIGTRFRAPVARPKEKLS